MSYWSETFLEKLAHVTLTFDSVTPKSIGFLCYPGCVDQVWGGEVKRVIKLLIGNEKFTDRQTCILFKYETRLARKVHKKPWIPRAAITHLESRVTDKSCIILQVSHVALYHSFTYTLMQMLKWVDKTIGW